MALLNDLSMMNIGGTPLKDPMGLIGSTQTSGWNSFVPMDIQNKHKAWKAGTGHYSENTNELDPLEAYKAQQAKKFATYQQLQSGNLPAGWSPKSGNVPTIDQWWNSGGRPVGNNSAIDEYFNKFYNMPSYGRSFLEGIAPIAAAAAIPIMGAAGVFGEGAAGAGAVGTEGTAALGGMGVQAPVGTALPTMAQEAAIGDLVATGMSQEAATAAVMGGGQSMGGGGSIWDKILGSATGKGAAGNLAVPGLLQILTNLYGANSAKNAANKAAAASDPFAGQRAFYQGELHKLFTDPKYLASTPGYQAGIDAVNARSAKLGQMFSGTNATDLQNFSMQHQLNYAQPLLQASGANVNPGYAGFLQQQGQQNQFNNIRTAAGSVVPTIRGLYDIFKTGNV